MQNVAAVGVVAHREPAYPFAVPVGGVYLDVVTPFDELGHEGAAEIGAALGVLGGAGGEGGEFEQAGWLVVSKGDEHHCELALKSQRGTGGPRSWEALEAIAFGLLGASHAWGEITEGGEVDGRVCLGRDGQRGEGGLTWVRGCGGKATTHRETIWD